MAETNILDRVAKLLAVQEARGATEAEASIAAEHVQRLLETHNLSLSQVEQHASNGVHGGIKRSKDDTTTASPFQPWRVSLMEGVCKNNFCLAKAMIFRDGSKRKQKLMLVGRELNVNVAKMTYDYIAGALVSELKKQGFSLTDKTGYSKEGNYFLEGAVSRVVERLDERRKEREDASTDAMAAAQAKGNSRELVLSDVYGNEADLNDDALNNFAPGTTAARRRENTERLARQQVKHDELVAQGVDNTKAWYLAYGYSEETATEFAKSYKRNTRRGASHNHAGHNWSRRDEAHYKKVTSGAYKAGVTTGSKIGLDNQIGASKRKQISAK